MIIEKLKKEDLLETIQLVKKNFPNCTIKEDIAFEDIDWNRNMVLVAKEKDQVVGHVWIQKIYDFYLQNYYYYLMYVCVCETYQNQGIGTRLLKEVEKKKQEEKIAYLLFTSNQKRSAANHLYQKLGYTKKDSFVYIKY